MKRSFVPFALLMSMFVLFGCTSSIETTTSTTDTTTNTTLTDTTSEVATGPIFTGVLMALGDEKSYIEETLLSSSLVSNTPTRLGFSHKLLPLSSATNSNFSFEGTIINGIYVSTKGNIEYLVIDIVQTVDLADSYTFNNIVIGSNGWTTDKIFTLGSENNKFYTSDDLTKIYIPVKITVDVSTTQEFTVKSIKYLDGVAYKAVRFADDVVDSIDILVAGNLIDFTFNYPGDADNPGDPMYGRSSVMYDMPSRTISMRMTNPDNLQISEIQINNQVAYSEETYTYANNGDIILPIPQDIEITTYNWVKVQVTYSILVTEDIPDEYTSVSIIFLASDLELIYDEGTCQTVLGPETYLIRSAADLMLFGSTYFPQISLIIVNDIDLRGIDFEPLNAGLIGIGSTENPNVTQHQQSIYTIHVDEGLLFADSSKVSPYLVTQFYIGRVVFDNTTFVNVDILGKTYDEYERTHFGEYISMLQKAN